jgi:hypothetical protein
MSINQQNAIVLQKKPTFSSRVKDAAFVGAVSASALFVTGLANAAELDFSGAAEETTGVKTSVVGIIGGLGTLNGIGIAWAYFKRTAK